MKPLLFSIFVMALFSCSKDEPEKPNTPPQAFEVTAKVEGTELTLTWTEAVDSDGDAVTYAVVYGDTLAKGLTARTYTLKDLAYETEISGTVVASDGRGGKIESGFKVKTDLQPFALIPDKGFEEFLVEQGIDDVLDGKILRAKAELIKEMKIEGNIKSLEGLEAFSNLEVLEIAFAEMEDLDLRGLDRLLDFQVHSSGKLKKINFTQNPLLKRIIIDSQPNTLYNSLIEELDVSKNPLLESIACGGNTLSKLNLSNNPELKSLYLQETNILTLDLAKNSKLESLSIRGGKVEKLDLTNNSKLLNLSIESSELKNLRLPDSKNLQSLFMVDFSHFDKIDISRYVNLESISFYSCGIETIDLNPFIKLKFFTSVGNSFQTIDLSKNRDLEQVLLYDNKIKELNLCQNEKLRYVSCGYGNLGVIYIPKSITPGENWKKDVSATYKVCD